MASISIVGFTPDFKVPGFYGETVYGAGAVTAASAPIRLLCVGLKGSTGTLTPNGSPVQVLSADDADSLAGAGGELARMLYAALRQPGVNVYAAAPSPAGGAVAASITITIAATPPFSSTGEWRYRAGGLTFSGAIGLTDTAANIAAAVAAGFNGRARSPFVAAAVGAVVTLTVKSAGVRGNQHVVFQDVSLLPATVTSTIAGGASVTGGGVYFANGAGTEDVSDLLTTIFPEEFGRIAFAQNDATNAAAWEAHLYAAAGPLEGRLQHGICAVAGTLTAATSLAQTTLNAERVQLLWLLYSETHPSEIAARVGALRAVSEQNDPCSAYDFYVLDGIAPQSQTADRPSRGVQQTALSNGVTPCTTNANGDVQVVRSITSKSRTNGVPDYRCLDTSDAVVPDVVRRQIELIWYFSFFPANPRVADDPPEGAQERKAGIATPRLWAKTVEKLLYDLERGDNRYVPSGRSILVDVAENPPVAVYDPVARRIMSAVPVKPAANNHAVGVSVRSMTSA